MPTTKKFQAADRGFIISHQAWYANARATNDVEVMFGDYPQGGGTNGEAAMVWTDLGGRHVPQLRAFDDCWAMLAAVPGLLKALGKVDDRCITVDQFVEILKGLGFKDLTQRVNPHTKNQPATCHTCGQRVGGE